MNSFDAVVLVATAVAVVGGWRVGFVARSFSWAGLAIGLFTASRLLPRIEGWSRSIDHDTLVLILVLTLAVGGLVGQLLGLVVGLRVRGDEPGGPHRLDRAGGALAGVLGVVAAVWLLLPNLARIPDWPAEQARQSMVGTWIQEHLPTPPDGERALRGFLGPRVFDGFVDDGDLGPPPVATGLTEEVQAQVARSTVKVEARACNRLQDGSGAVIGPDLIVTNAHVVAGSRSVVVQRFPDGKQVGAEVVAFDPDVDLALLRTNGIERPALPLDDGSFGEGGTGLVFGRPGGGPLDPSPFKVGREVVARGWDIYDEHTADRRVFYLAADLAPGDSGSALIDPRGVVVGVAFAISPDRPGVAYALAVEELLEVLQRPTSDRVDTGRCLG